VLHWLILIGACLFSGVCILTFALYISGQRHVFSRLKKQVQTGTGFIQVQFTTVTEVSYGLIETDAMALHEQFESMFMNIPLQRCRQLALGIPLVLASFGLLLSWQVHWLANVCIAALFGQLGRLSLRYFNRFLYHRYVEKFDDQLTDALTMASNAIRVGLSLPQALEIIEKEMPSPVSQEFQLVLKEHRMGKNLDDALDRMASRLPSTDLSLVINSIVILRETGGSLSETFDTVVNTIMEREKVKGKIRTLTAQGRVQGLILTGMPFVLMYVLHVINPEYIAPLFTTLLGWMFLLFMGLLLFGGGLLIHKIITIDV
jgi:tight adherence protein B